MEVALFAYPNLLRATHVLYPTHGFAIEPVVGKSLATNLLRATHASFPTHGFAIEPVVGIGR